MAKLTKIHVENFKKIQLIEYTPKGNVSFIGGMNEQGKSSLLDSISVLLQGKAIKIPQPVRTGAKRALISGEIISDSWDAFDDLIIQRSISKKGNWSIKVTQKATGKTIKTPETFLKTIFGEPLNPVEFINMSMKEKIEKLKKITGLDLSDLDLLEEQAYSARRDLKREIAQKKIILSNTKNTPDLPDEEIKTVELLKKYNEQKEKITAHEKKLKQSDEILAENKTAENQIDKLSEDIKKIKRHIRKGQDFIEENLEKYATLEAEINQFKPIDIEQTLLEVDEVDEKNKQIRENIKYKEVTAELLAIEKKQDFKNVELNRIRGERSARLAAINFPVQELSFNQENVLYKGLPFDKKQLSTEELLRISFLIAIAANPSLKNILIKEGSLLDQNNLQIISEIAEKENIHLFIEVVGEDYPAALIIENGQVKTAKNIEPVIVDDTLDNDEDFNFDGI